VPRKIWQPCLGSVYVGRKNGERLFRHFVTKTFHFCFKLLS
jgi:hypothetical protein